MVIFTWSVTLELLFNGIPISDIVKLLLHLPGILVVSSAGNALIILLLRRLNDMIREIMDASGVELVLIGPGSVDQNSTVNVRKCCVIVFHQQFRYRSDRICFRQNRRSEKWRECSRHNIRNVHSFSKSVNNIVGICFDGKSPKSHSPK
ncbi:uncharacterized protein [Euphorbia lathyris]|uniref:uncharacterized protein isoform X2 n=1 Tax=Euphorbia lathyris TaxID=212925 RepID=UPI0033135607